MSMDSDGRRSWEDQRSGERGNNNQNALYGNNLFSMKENWEKLIKWKGKIMFTKTAVSYLTSLKAMVEDAQSNKRK